MEDLGTILEAMKSPEASQREPQRGLTTTGGQAITARREKPLAENQLTLIVSKTLQGMPQISFEKKKIYGRKEVNGFFYENEPIDEVLAPVVSVSFKEDAPLSLLNAALAMSPPEAIVRHITRLAIHKKFGSNDKDRSVLITDYAVSLSEFPEFLVYLVCRHFWEDDKRPFVPYIGELKEICKLIMVEYEKRRQPIIPQIKKEKYYSDPRENPMRRRLCDFLISKGEEDHFDQIRLWSNYDLERQANLKTFGVSS